MWVSPCLAVDRRPRHRTISLCLRVRLRLLTAGLVLLRAAGETAAEEAVTAAAAREEGRDGNGNGIGIGIGVGARGGVDSRREAGVAGSMEQHKMSMRSRVILLRGACRTLEELDALREALRARKSRDAAAGGGPYGRGGVAAADGANGTSNGRKRGPGAWMRDGVLEQEGDRALCVSLVSVCVSIVEEMTVTKGYVLVDGGEGPEVHDARRPTVIGMSMEVERIVREEKVRAACLGGSLAVMSWAARARRVPPRKELGVEGRALIGRGWSMGRAAGPGAFLGGEGIGGANTAGLIL